MPIEGGFVGMVDREEFDEWLRDRARQAGASRFAGPIETDHPRRDGPAACIIQAKGRAGERIGCRPASSGRTARTRRSAGRRCRAAQDQFVFAYHEIVETPRDGRGDPNRCEIISRLALARLLRLDLPSRDTMSVGRAARKRASRWKTSVDGSARTLTGLGATRDYPPARARRSRCKPLPRWDNGRDVVLAGDAAGVVAPASGEGIYYAMFGGRLGRRGGRAVPCDRRRARAGRARKRFMKAHGRVFWVSGSCNISGTQRQAARAFRQHVPRSRRPAPDLGSLHEQGTAARATRWRMCASSSRISRISPTWPRHDRRSAGTGTRSWSRRRRSRRRRRRRTDDRCRRLVREPELPVASSAELAVRPGLDDIYVLIAVSGVIAWDHAPDARPAHPALPVRDQRRAEHLCGARCSSSCGRPDWAFYELLAVLAVRPRARRVRRGDSATAAWLIAPYLVWVSFAGWLNWRVVQLNKPFGRAPGPRRILARQSSGRGGGWRSISSTAGDRRILAPVAIEAPALLGLRASGRRGPPTAPLIANLLAGAFLLIAPAQRVDRRLGDAHLALPDGRVGAHVADLFARWEAPAGREIPLDARAPVRATFAAVKHNPSPRAAAQKSESSDA